MMKLAFAFLLVLGAIAIVRAVGVDMGTCSCLCGGDSETAILSGGETTPARTFYDRLRGPTGAIGRPGKSGPKGEIGSPGLRGPRGPPGESFGGPGSFIAPATSCFELLSKGITTSGMYTIKPENHAVPMQVFCDLQSAGGGWTLVASVHENNIEGKCTIGDKWSSEQGSSITENAKVTESSNWENFNVFGTPDGATSADYKSPAYFALDATDLMIAHVPNDVNMLEAADQATLQYYTNNGFMTNYGGNLRLLFSKYFPMKKIDNPGTALQGVQTIISTLNDSAYLIRNVIPDFYNFIYDFDGNVQNYIKDGGQDMFDSGNKVFYKIGTAEKTQIVYNQNYKNQTQGVEVMSSTSHPFQTVMWIGNNDRTVQTFSLRVESGTGADGDGTGVTFEGDLSSTNLTGKYFAYSVSGANDPSLCEVFYYLANENSWGSVLPTDFTKPSWSSGTDSLTHEVQVEGRPKGILLGYMLLSRRNELQVTQQQVEAALGVVMGKIDKFSKIDEYNCQRYNESVIAPIEYLKGDDATVLAGIPPLQKTSVHPGYIQLRTLSPSGQPNALCPGVKSESCRPQSYCVGGINSMALEMERCGDFSGWDGVATDEPTDTEPNGSAKSLNDLKSTLLLFTRNVPRDGN